MHIHTPRPSFGYIETALQTTCASPFHLQRIRISPSSAQCNYHNGRSGLMFLSICNCFGERAEIKKFSLTYHCPPRSALSLGLNRRRLRGLREYPRQTKIDAGLLTRQINLGREAPALSSSDYRYASVIAEVLTFPILGKMYP